MDYITNQINALIGEEDLEPSERVKKLKEVLKWDTYVKEFDLKYPETNLYNPAIEGYKEYLSWSDSGGWEPVNETEVLRHYPEHIPTDEALKYLQSKSIIEIGAGNGYWTQVINKNGGDCIASDISPENIDESVVDYPYEINFDNEWSVTIWDDVIEKDYSIIQKYPDRDVLFCHPEGLQWTENVLDVIDESQKLILVAGWYPSPNATPMFFKKLINDWNLKELIPVYDWVSGHSAMYVFEKN